MNNLLRRAAYVGATATVFALAAALPSNADIVPVASTRDTVRTSCGSCKNVEPAGPEHFSRFIDIPSPLLFGSDNPLGPVYSGEFISPYTRENTIASSDGAFYILRTVKEGDTLIAIARELKDRLGLDDSVNAIMDNLQSNQLLSSDGNLSIFSQTLALWNQDKDYLKNECGRLVSGHDWFIDLINPEDPLLLKLFELPEVLENYHLSEIVPYTEGFGFRAIYKAADDSRSEDLVVGIERGPVNNEALKAVNVNVSLDQLLEGKQLGQLISEGLAQRARTHLTTFPVNN